jgi:hypothetical protein
MKKQTRAEKLIDKRIEQAYYRTCSGVQIPMLAIPGIFRSVREQLKDAQERGFPYLTDEQLDVLVKVTVEVFRVN